MTSYKKLVKNKENFMAMTGYTEREFQALLPYFSKRFETHMEQYTLEGKVRKRRGYMAYRSSPLPTMEDKLVFILVYLKTNNLQSVQANLFEMHQPEANLWIHLLVPILKDALKDTGMTPARSMEEVDFDVEEGDLFFHDGTERGIPRPLDDDDQKTYYSGKKKRHSLKNNMLAKESCYILYLSPTVEGKKHDKKLADESNYLLPKDSILVQDTGFQGFVVEGATILQPKKKPRNAELSQSEKDRNTLISRLRVRIEHVVGSVKRYRIIKDIIRNWKVGFRDAVIEICCALHNFRLQYRPWNYPDSHKLDCESL